MDKVLNKILNKVSKPTRYVGGEYNSPFVKNDAKVKMCYCFPDVYEVAMSNIGVKILGEIFNKHENFFADRCYTPWPDMGEELEKNNYDLFSLDARMPLKEFDIIGFSMQYELSYTNMLYMLKLSNIPFYAKDRNNEMPLVLAGGPCAVNFEPIADFIDLAVVGDGEVANIKVAELYLLHKQKGFIKQNFLKEVAKLEGVYVPSLFKILYKSSGEISEIIGTPVKRAIVKDLDKACYPTKFLVPNMDIVHNRGVVEIFRGCTRGCRFCQAGYIYRPVRQRKPETIVNIVNDMVKTTGFEEISLSSLSTGDYPNLVGLLSDINKTLEGKNVKLALPSLRLDSFEGEFSDSSRKSSLTFAPEAGTQRLRDVINKNITEADILDSLQKAFTHGYTSVKLYFMIGLPTETEEDILGIVNIAQKIKDVYKNVTGKNNVKITISTSTLVPKPFTPFMWARQITLEEISTKQKILSEKCRRINVNYNYHDAKTSLIECALARGDRKLNKVILSAFEMGAKFDGWSEFFKHEIWLNAFKENNIDLNFYLSALPTDGIMPWETVDVGVSKEFFLREWILANKGVTTKDCRQGCNACGLTNFEVCE